MKIEAPPTVEWDNSIISDIIGGHFNEFLNRADVNYYYWDELKHRTDNPYSDPQKAWQMVKMNRRLNYQSLEIANLKFKFFMTNQIQRDLHEFDLKMIGGLYENPITTYEEIEYLGNSLNEEAIASSQIEGAATTTKVAWRMLKTGRAPKNESEQMIFNNLRAIQLIEGEKDRALDFNLILELHRIMTMNTKAGDCAGTFRRGPVFVTDHVDGEIAHIPPDWQHLESLMEAVCIFANQDTIFIHPIVKASILHFLIGYIHPFSDGNGRTARSLFYWYLFKKGYTLIKNISISRAILDSRIQYDKAFLKTEADELDLNYFITYSIKRIRVAFDSLIRYRDRKKSQREAQMNTAQILRDSGLNKRQADLIAYLYIKDERSINISTYSIKYEIVRQTAKADLEELKTKGLLKSDKVGREVIYQLISKSQVDRFLGNNTSLKIR